MNHQPMKVWIVLAALNEEKRIKAVLEKTKQHETNIILVDDASQDSTYEIAKSLGAKVLRHAINLGKGAAVRTGCDFAFSNGADAVILMDSDGQHDPNEIPHFKKELLKDSQIVFGVRKFDENMPPVSKFGNWFLTTATKILFKIKIQDTQGGYRAITKKAYKKIKWKSNGYAMETEMIAKAGKTNLKYTQIPIKTIYLEKYKGTTPWHGIKIFINMLLWRIQ